MSRRFTTVQAPDEGRRTQVWVTASSQMMSLSTYCAPHWNSDAHGSPSFAGVMHFDVVPSSEETQARPDAQTTATVP
jgi:hypothetical protein